MDGMWVHAGAPALVDWCEANYAVTGWVAEWWNFLSSVVMIGLGLFGLWRVRGAELRFRVGMLGTCVVGAGSAAFHGTLLRLAQAADELPMVWLGLACVWTLLDREKPAGEGRGLAVGLLAFGVVFCVACALVPWAFALFIAVYGVAIAWVAIRTMQLAFFRPTTPRLRRTAAVVVLAYLGGFFGFWVPEHVLLGCDSPIQALQLHSFWHLGAGIGTIAWWEWAWGERAEASGIRL